MTFLYHESCPKCGSSDARAVYEDGHHCWVCHDHSSIPTKDKPRVSTEKTSRFRPLEVVPIPLVSRGLTQDSMHHWGAGEVEYMGQEWLALAYKDEAGAITGYKLRDKNKDFKVIGKLSGLYGKWLWRDGGKKVVVTEGELDAISMSQVQGHKWPVVSVQTGASGAVSAFKKDLDWLEGFDQVVIMFDMDEPGQKAAQEAAAVLPTGKAFIASLPLNDPSDMLQAQRTKELIDAMWSAKAWRPDGIVIGEDIWEKIQEADTERTVPYPWAELQKLTYGLRSRELVVICAGTGIGKSTVCRELAHYLVSIDEKVGYIALEESVKRTALGIMGVELDLPLHLLEQTQGGYQARWVDETITVPVESGFLTSEGTLIPESDIRSAFEATVNKMVLYDHFGSLKGDNLLSKMRYMVVSLGVQWLILDHLSIVISGQSDGDERRNIDNLMTKLRSLVQETGAGLILVSHLKRPEGKSFEDGAQVRLSHLRGSASIEQLSDRIIGCERNMQDEKDSNRMNLRLLKNRHVGINGLAGTLSYELETGRLTEVSAFEETF